MIRALLVMALTAFSVPVWAVSVTRTPDATSASPIWLDPSTPDSTDAAALVEAGYVSEEWFQSGIANVYGYGAGGKVEIERRNIPYTTRLLVIRPRDPRRFSGTVQLNPFHPMMGNNQWNTIASYAMERGDVFVGVMIGADDNTRQAPAGPVPMMATEVLGWFNSSRYAAINWPMDEDGIRWDVYADTARMIRSAEGPLRGLTVSRIYSFGWSYTGSLLRTWINSGFHATQRQADGRPLIDGYLLGISSFSFRSGYVPINSHTPNLAEDDPRRANVPVDVPVIELQSENEAITNREPQTADRDISPGAHRLYEVPGLTHGTGRQRSNVADLQIAMRLGRAQEARVDRCSFPQTDVDMAAFARAAHENLEAWSRRGIAPPRVVRLEQVAGVPRRDINGNTLGGVRPAQLEVPLARYGAALAGSGCDAGQQGIGSPTIPMRRILFSKEQLAVLYPGGKADYLRRFDAAIDRLVAGRWLRPVDASIQKFEARKNAEEVFP
jgi:hypothetical protein